MTRLGQEAGMFRNERSTARDQQRSNGDVDAVFIGWQPTRTGAFYALYNVTAADHPMHGSTLTGNSLLKLNLEIPATPPRPTIDR
jgi:hypothetical protein